MVEKKKIKKAGIITLSILLVIILIASTCGIIFWFLNKTTETPYLNMLCKNRVLNAQYVPDINKLASTTPDGVSSASNNPSSNSTRIDEVEKTITLDNFNAVIEDIGDIDNPFDREFTISEVKEEVYLVLSQTSVFDKWIWFKDSEELSGSGNYYISYDEKNSHITIMRTSGFQPWVYDSKLGKIMGNDEYNSGKSNYPNLEYITYKIDYYYNEQGVEVVECEIVSFLHHYEKKYISQYQYMKNVKDTSFTKYIITPCVYVSGKQNDGSWGYDIDTQNKLGNAREFIQMDYSNPNDISLLFINQTFAGKYNTNIDTSHLKFYRKLNNELTLYNALYSYGDLQVSTSYGSNNNYFINTLYSGDNSVFDYYISEYTINENSNVTNNDPNFANRSSENIESMYREMYYSDGTNILSIAPGGYYLKKNDDSEEAFSSLQNIPLLLNNSLSSLAKNTKMTNNKINEILKDSPTYLDIEDSSGAHTYEHFVDKYLKSITQNIIKTSTVANDYENIKNGWTFAVGVNPATAIATKDYITLNNFTNSSSINEQTITYSATASISKSILLKDKAEYQLALVAKGTANNYQILQKGKVFIYKGENLNLSINNTFDLNDLKITINDNYTIGIALLFNYNKTSVVCSNVQYLTFTESPTLNIEKSSYNGFDTTYVPYFSNNNLNIIASVKDVQGPVIEIENNIVFETGSTIIDLIEKLNITDNSIVTSIKIYRNSNRIYNYKTSLETGSYEITVCDIVGNITIKTISITID